MSNAETTTTNQPGTGPPPPNGLAWPAVRGRRSTTPTATAIIADAVRDVDAGLTATVEQVSDWRRDYPKIFRKLTELGASSPDAAIRSARNGLASMRRRFTFVRDGAETSLDDALRGYTEPALRTVRITGSGAREDVNGLTLPYHGERLAGGGIARLGEDWVRRGIVEPSLADALDLVVEHPEWLDLRDVTVVVLGAGAEMGPLVSLLRWGAHVVALDLPRPATWERLMGLVAASAGTMSVPVPVSADVADDHNAKEIAAVAGADLITQLPETVTWLRTFEGPLTVGNYVYADGGLHVLTSVAGDVLMTAIGEGRPEVSLAFLATPTDAFVVPEEVVENSRRRAKQQAGQRRAMQRAAQLASLNTLFQPNYPRLYAMDDGRLVGINDAIVPRQGPNYLVAKRLQRWRAAVERMNGRLVSLNVAPPTRTHSVVKNRALAAAYAGAPRFGLEIFDPSTSNTLMAALLVHDLRNPSALANPATPLHNPIELLWQGANHGGLWRNPFSAESVLGIAVVLGMFESRA